jgi:uncharacterized membrane protein YraQ (UPF0718 family)
MANFAVLLRCFLGALLLVASTTNAHESCCKFKLNELVGGASEFIEDPDDQHPPAADAAGNRRWIPNPEDFKPSYWDDEDDGLWEPRELLNTQYDWSPRLIPNPLYVPPPTYWDKLFVEVNAALPWITLGIVLTGALSSLMTWLPPTEELFAVLKSSRREGDDVFAVAAAAVLGLATPLCSCGAIPLAASFLTSGIPLSSTMAFLTASQSAGLDSAAITWGLLGPMAVLCRLGGAILLALAAGLVCGKTVTTTTTDKEQSSEGGDCCASSKKDSSSSSSTCGSTKELPGGSNNSGSQGSSSLSRLWVSLSDTAVEILPTVFTGLALSTAALHFFPSFLTIYSGESFLVRSLLLLTAMPMQLCEHSTVTLAAAIQKAGGSPGLSFSFLLAAPATNMPTLLLLLRYGGTIGTVVGVVAAIAGTALAMSYAVDGVGLDLLVDKDPNSQMADLPAWYVAVVPYLVSSLFCTGAFRQALEYVNGTKKGAETNVGATTTEKAKSD